MYCYPCRLLTTNPGRSDPAFVSVGYSDWKHAAGKKGAFNKHEKLSIHKKAMLAWKDYEEGRDNQSSLPHQLDKTRRILVAESRHYLKTIAEIILLCEHQEIALKRA